MAPTEVLATQLFESFIEYFKHTGISIGLITGSGCRKFPTKVASAQKPWTEISRTQLLKWVKNGEIAITIGTHALISKSVDFKDLDSLFGGEWVGRFPALPPLRVRCRTDEELRRVSAAARTSRVPVEAVRGGDRSPPVERQVRRYAFTEYLSRLMRDDRAFGALVRGEIAKDAGHKTERAYLKALRDRAERKGEEALSSGGAKERAFTEKALHDKALSLALHEVLWSHGLGGSCPLVCGNCSDRADPSDPDAVHRCASKTTYRGKTIHIGLH
jgi:hypothetical protein